MLARATRILMQRMNSRSSLNANQLIPKRNGHWEFWVYRDKPVKPPRSRYLIADSCNAFMWWWIFVHCWYQWGHLVGEYDYPDRHAWTDAELGVVEEL